MEHVNLIGKLLVCAVISVVPGFFVFLFATSAYRDLRQRHAQWIQAERDFKSTPAPEAELQKRLRAASSAYNQRRRTFWGAIWGTVCRLPPAPDNGDAAV